MSCQRSHYAFTTFMSELLTAAASTKFEIPQAVLALRGSHGVALEAPMKSGALRRRCAGADFIDFYGTW